MVHDPPKLWVQHRDSHRVVSDEHGTRLEPTGGPAARVVLSLIFLVAASMFLGTSASIIQNHTESSSVVDGEEACRSDQVEVKIGDNPLYCKWIGFPDSNELVKLEVSEDQHIREETRFQDGVWVETYRWEDVDESIVYGFIEDGTYFCVRFIPEFSLEEDWKVEDLYGSFTYPEWCETEVTDEESRTYEEGAHPYDDVWMYHASDIGEMTTFLHMHKIEEDTWFYQEFESRTSVAADLAYDAWHQQTEYLLWGVPSYFPLELVWCSLPIGLIFLFAADQRRTVFVIDRSSQRLTRKRAGPLPSFTTTWSGVDCNSVQLLRSVRIRKHSSGGEDGSHVSHWTTQHPGVNVMLTMEGHTQTLFFFEDDNDLTVHEEVLKDLMAAMGVEFNVDGMPNPKAEMFARPTLQYLADYNGGVSDWNDDTANFIIGWYYESDPNFIEKYPQAEHDPEFMLEPGGDRPFKEMYRRPLYDGAGLTSVRSTEDAQRLLDHVLALRFLESSTPKTTLKKEPKTEVNTTVAHRSFSVGLKEDVGAESSGPSSDSETPSFWSNLEADDS